MRAGIGPPRRRRRTTRQEWAVGLPLMILAVLVVAAILVATLAYALVGTDAPFLVNARGPDKGPAPTGARIEAAVLFAATVVVVLAGLWAYLRRRLARACVAVDAQGVWLTRGRYVQQGLHWREIAAIDVVEGEREGEMEVGVEATVGEGEGAGAVRAPFLDLYPVDRAEDSYGPLGSRVLNARPAARGLRGRRYALELVGGQGELAVLRAELRRLGARRPGAG
ncbi:hypothetical protein AB0I10_10080 [Streptomyces sp. NPDC050636]|uniref:hypothetical protein n=1 Tax=Streptomyces sp. NPDC050636 TaxID=3154510 RepID=UPI00342D9470